MRVSSVLIGAGAVLGIRPFFAVAAAASSKPLTSCPGNEKLCFSVSVPSSTASSGTGDLFFQIQAPSTYEWAAFGQGLEMAGSNIFVIYADAAQTNVTLSPRLGISEVEPYFDAAAQVELLAGSGVANGLMTANVRCRNCASWEGGKMSLNDPTSSWIWAYKTGSALRSNSLSTSLALHDDMGTVVLDLTKAVGASNDVNPFVTTHGSAVPANGTATAGVASLGSSSSGGGVTDVSTATAAHGVLMGITMLVLFPCGALLRRILPSLSIWTHAAMQSVALALTIAGAGLGLSIATTGGTSTSSHALLGIAVTILMMLQPAWGVLQHRHFLRYRERGIFGRVHRVLGAGAILLGIINGGLGLQLADAVGSAGGNAYVLGAAVLGSIYITTYAAIAFGKWSGEAQSPHGRQHNRRVRDKLGATNEMDIAMYPTYGDRRQPRRHRGA